MTALPVEAVLVVFYGPEAHHVTYGRGPSGGGYTKDYIQLRRTPEFMDWLGRHFPVPSPGATTFPLVYRGPGGPTNGSLIYRSNDRPHLAWETVRKAPPAWRMTSSPSPATDQTIPGNPGHLNVSDAEAEFETLAAKGAGQPYLFAIKLRGEERTLHVRAYLDGPAPRYSFADLNQIPFELQALARGTRRQNTLAWADFNSGGIPATVATERSVAELADSSDVPALLASLTESEARHLADYLAAPGYGLFFDPEKNHDAWTLNAPLPDDISGSRAAIVALLLDRPAASPDDDIAAERLPSDGAEVEALKRRVEERNFAVPDATATVKTRGSSQRVFADAVKANYGYRCAITGITTPAFLVASHIVPWSEDENIRVDPANGICLSLIVDRAFESGFIRIEDDYTIRVDRRRVGRDLALLSVLEAHDGAKLDLPSEDSPNPEYLARRRDLVDRREAHRQSRLVAEADAVSGDQDFVDAINPDWDE